MKVSTTSGAENRLFLTPTNNSGEQPSYGFWTQFASSTSGMNCGTRRNSTTQSMTLVKPYSDDTYYNFQIERNGTTITSYINDTQKGTLTESWIDNYSSWWFSYTLWKNNSTLTWKNLKIKAL